jgi:hypothetical protein
MRVDCHGKIRIQAGTDLFAEIIADGDRLDISLSSLRPLKNLGRMSAILELLRRALVLAQKCGFTQIMVRLRDREILSWTASAPPSLISVILRLPGLRIHAPSLFSSR